MLSLICFTRMLRMFFSKQYHIVGQSWNVRCDEKCSSCKHINNSIPIEDLIRRRQGRQYNVTLLHIYINDDMCVSCL